MWLLLNSSSNSSSHLSTHTDCGNCIYVACQGQNLSKIHFKYIFIANEIKLANSSRLTILATSLPRAYRGNDKGTSPATLSDCYRKVILLYYEFYRDSEGEAITRLSKKLKSHAHLHNVKYWMAKQKDKLSDRVCSRCSSLHSEYLGSTSKYFIQLFHHFICLQ